MMEQRNTKQFILVGFLAVILLSIVFIAKAAAISKQSQQEKEKAEWLNIAKDFFTFKMPKGYDVLLPDAAGGGGETYINFDLYPKSSKNQSPKIILGVYLANHSSIDEYISWIKEYGAKDLGLAVTINGIKWRRFVPEGKEAKTYECHGTIKGEKMFEFCLDSGASAPSSKLKKTYTTFLRSVKIK